MARQKNLVATEPLTVAISAEVYKTLESLTKSGYWGKNAADTAEEMIRRGIASLDGGATLVASGLKHRPKSRRR